MINLRFSAYLYGNNHELLLNEHHDSFDELVAKMMSWLENAPINFSGVIYDHDQEVVKGRYRRHLIE